MFYDPALKKAEQATRQHGCCVVLCCLTLCNPPPPKSVMTPWGRVRNSLTPFLGDGLLGDGHSDKEVPTRSGKSNRGLMKTYSAQDIGLHAEVLYSNCSRLI